MFKEKPVRVGLSPPKDAKSARALMEPGIDSRGLNVYFGFELKEGGRICLTATHGTLGQIINYLQGIATMARQRRAQVDPTAADTEVRAVESSPVRQIDIDLDIGGQFALWQCTMIDGARLEAEIPLDLMEGLREHLPSRIDEMKRRQAAHRKPN
jgi:hypothetical protein